MNMKSILLGTAAGLMVASGAYAADLPGEPAPAAVDYVKVCDAFGAGFFYIPGTQTCLDISGRVRATARYQTNATDGNDRDTLADDAQLSLSADGRVDFDARTASDLGTVRSFFRLSSGAVTYSAGKDGVLGTADDSLGDRGVQVDAAYIQVGMLTVGYAGTIFNGDRLYGIDDAGNGLDDRFVAQVVASGLGGGFWVGAGIGGVGNQLSTSLNGTGGWVAPLVEAAVGIADQSWGDAALYGYYSKDVDDSYGIKAAANLKIAEGFKARLTASYFNDYNGAAKDTDTFGLSGALAYAATDAATVYAGVAYDIVDGPDAIAANVGVDYTLAEGLVGTGEVSYKDVGGKNGDSLSVIGRLTRTW